MFHRYGKKGRLAQTKPLKDLTKILSVEQILNEEKRNQVLEQITFLSALEKPRFESIGLTIVHHLINHCQLLPETSNSYYSQLGGLIDHALYRTEAALTLFKQYLVLDDSGLYSEEQKLWQYVLFSAALLQGLGKLQIDLTVDLFDNNGQFLKQWNPLLENLILVGSHYCYSFQKESDPEFRKRLNILMGKFLMPASGFSWIASKNEALQVWLALLNEDLHAAGTLGAILKRADALALQLYFNQRAKHYGSRSGRYGLSTFTGGTPESIGELEQQIGNEFIQWLHKTLASGQIMINKAPLLLVPGGLLMCADIFKYFIREHPEYKNWQAIQNGFLALGLHKVGADGATSFRYEQSNNQQMHSGIVFALYELALPEKVMLHNLNTGQSNWVSSIELVHQSQFNNIFTEQNQLSTPEPLLSLDSSGEWLAPKSAQYLAPHLLLSL